MQEWSISISDTAAFVGSRRDEDEHVLVALLLQEGEEFSTGQVVDLAASEETE